MAFANKRSYNGVQLVGSKEAFAINSSLTRVWISLTSKAGHSLVAVDAPRFHCAINKVLEGGIKQGT
jgi:hypothetical protein